MNKINFSFEPIFNKESRILILGSFPSVLSRENEFYYGNPQNRFWRLMAKILEEEVPATNEEKKDFLLRNHIALTDAALACRITGSLDETMEEIQAQDLDPILSASQVSHIFTNGRKAEEIMKKEGVKTIYLPSTSPRNARYSLDDLYAAWAPKIRTALDLD